MSFGMVFTSGRLEVWGIEKEDSKNEHLKEDVALTNVEALYTQLQKKFLELGFSQETSQKMDVFGIYIPEYLKKSLVCGITKDGSLKAGEKLSRALLLSPEFLYAEGDFNETVKDLTSDVVVISGGFDDSDDLKMKKLILDISESSWFKKIRPKVIYAGNRQSVSVAQLSFSPFTDFYEIGNILEENFFKEDLDTCQQLNLCEKAPFKIEDDMSKKIMLSTYHDSIDSISKYFCGINSGRALTVLINKNYSILNQCRIEAGSPVCENIAFPKEALRLCPDDFSDSYTEFTARNDSFAVDIFSAEDVLPIGKKKRESFFRPDKIVGVSISDDVNLKKFLDLISDPDIVRGIVEYYFDKSGFFLMCGSILSSGVSNSKERVEKIIEDQEIDSGWLIIPDGRFDKDQVALEVYVGGDDKDKASKLLWGKRYTIPVKEESVVELRFKGSAFLLGRDQVVILKTGSRSRDLVIDIRKEKS